MSVCAYQIEDQLVALAADVASCEHSSLLHVSSHK